jgi:hypothetical protein
VRRVPDEWKFSTPVSRLYRYIDKEGAIRTPDGLGKLLMAHSYPKGCCVELTAERTVARYKATTWRICRYYDYDQVREA